jgi:hypothetical protein
VTWTITTEIMFAASAVTRRRPPRQPAEFVAEGLPYVRVVGLSTSTTVVVPLGRPEQLADADLGVTVAT